MRQSEFLRKGLTMLLVVVMIIGFLPGVGSVEVSAEESGTSEATITPSKPKGEGTEDSPYQIGTAAELYWFADKVNNENATYKNANAVLTADITVNTGVLNEDGELNDTGKFIKWTPIGTESCKYQGTFDGQNHTISGLYFNDGTVDYVGLFGYTEGGKILNVGVVDSYFEGENHVGGVCGYMCKDSTMTNCYNAGSVKGRNIVGGILGGNLYTQSIKNCYNTGKVSGTESVGGVCGYLKGNNFENCYNIGEVSGTEKVGGVCGVITESIITNCYYDKDAYSGGAIGEYDILTIVDNVSGKTTEEMHNATFCKLIGYESYQNGICILCQEAYQEAVRTEDKYDIDKDGKKDVVYEIGNAGQLYWFAEKVDNENDETYKNANAVLTADITVNTGVLNEEGNLVKDTSKFIKWTPIGTESCEYQGRFDGQNHTISGLYFDDKNAAWGGLFGGMYKGNISNVGVVDSYFDGAGCAGGICGFNSGGTIMNSYYVGGVSGSSNSVGGICGQNINGSIIKGCYNSGAVSGSSESICVGGVCGVNSDSTIMNSYNVGNVKSDKCVGGVCGINYGEGTIQNCYNIGNVSGVLVVGSICGYNYGTIQNCYNIGNVSGIYVMGSICGSNYNTIQNCYYDSEIGEAIGKDEGGTATNVEGKTTEQFQSGEVAYLLQDGQEDQAKVVWGQKIGTDSYPVLGGSEVYKKGTYNGCEGKPGNAVSYFYSNTDKDQNIYAPHTDDGSVEGSVAYDNKCDLCGKEIHSFKEDGSCKDAGCVYHKGIITNVSYPTKIVYSGDVANAEPKAGDFTVNSGQALTFNWYQGDVTSGKSLGAAPKEAGTYTLVVKADGAKVGDVIYTAAELPVKVTIEKEPVKEQPTTPKPSDTTTEQQPSGTNTAQQPSSTTASQPPKNGDVVTDEKTKAKFEVTDVSKKEVTYHAPVDNKAKDITVPDTVTINGEVYKVTKIADNAFKGNKTVTTITIGSNIQTIGKNAFSGCKKLKTIIIKSKTLTDKKIAKKAFKGISKKTVIKVPKKKLAAYKKFLKKKGLSSKNKVKGY